MKKLSIGILLLSMITVYCGKSYAEQIALRLDGREWEMVYKTKNDTQGIAGFVLKGETNQNWSELVIAQTFFGLQKKATAKDWAEAAMKDIKSICPEAKCNIIKNGNNIIMDLVSSPMPNNIPRIMQSLSLRCSCILNR